MPNTKDNLPNIVGKPAGVRELSTAVSRLDSSGLDSLSASSNNLSGGIFNLAGSLARLKNDNDMNDAKHALINANQELDIFVAEEKQRKGADAAGAVERFNKKYAEIREKHSRNLSGVGKKTYAMQYDNAYGGLYTQMFHHQARETDQATALANKELAQSYLQRLNNDPNDDSAFDNYMSIRDAEYDRMGIAPNQRLEIRDNEIQQIGMMRIEKQLQAGNLIGAGMLLDRMRPGGEYLHKLTPENYKLIQSRVQGMQNVENLYSTVDHVFAETQSRVNAFSAFPDEVFMEGREKIRANFTGKEQDKALQLYRSREKELRDAIAAEQDAFLAGMRNVYSKNSYVQSRKDLDEALLKISNSVLKDKAEQQMRQWYGIANADDLNNRNALEVTMIKVKKDNLNAYDARSAFIDAGGDCDDKSLQKLGEAVRNSKNLPEISLVYATSKTMGYDTIPSGFIEYLNEVSIPGQMWKLSDVRREMADYLATKVSNYNWIKDINSNLKDMQSKIEDAYLTEEQALDFYLSMREEVRRKKGTLPLEYRDTRPSDDKMTNFMSRFGFYKGEKGLINSKTKYVRNADLDARQKEKIEKQLNKGIL